MTPFSTKSSHPTQKEIAVLAGVSRESVSHILGGTSNRRYSAETRERVLKAAEQLNYHPNRMAQTIRTGQSGMIGVAIFGGGLNISQRAFQHLPGDINHHGFEAFMMNPARSAAGVDRMVAEFIQLRVQGVITGFMADYFQTEHVEKLRRANIPLISIYGDHRLGAPVIWDDIYSSRYHLTRHLLSLGHRHLLCTVGGSKGMTVMERISGFQRAIEERGTHLTLTPEEYLDQWPRLAAAYPDAICGVTLRLRSGATPGALSDIQYEFSKKLFAQSRLPHACLCTNDAAAFGFFSAAAEMNVRIPQDIAVTGTDNDHFGKYPVYGLTTIEPDIEQAATRAIELLIRMIQGKEVPSFTNHTPSLILRTSCGRASHLPEAKVPVESVRSTINS